MFAEKSGSNSKPELGVWRSTPKVLNPRVCLDNVLESP